MNDVPPCGRIILGGSFDPVHRGHLYIASALADILHSFHAFLMPCHTPPHRPAPVANPAMRLAMAEQAVAGTAIRVDAREIRRGGISYTLDTLREMRDETGPDLPLCLALGADAFAAIDSWKDWQDLFTLAHLALIPRAAILVPRTGTAGQVLAERECSDLRPLREHPAGSVWIAPFTPPPLSATNLRAAIAAGQAPEKDLPPGVWHYICEHSLYRAGSDGRS